VRKNHRSDSEDSLSSSSSSSPPPPKKTKKTTNRKKRSPRKSYSSTSSTSYSSSSSSSKPKKHTSKRNKNSSKKQNAKHSKIPDQKKSLTVKSTTLAKPKTKDYKSMKENIKNHQPSPSPIARRTRSKVPTTKQPFGARYNSSKNSRFGL